MNRRDFIKKTLQMGITAGAAAVFGNFNSLAAAPVKKDKFPDLTAVKGGDPVSMFRQGIKAMGGMGEFVKKGQSVVVKPNIGWDTSVERAANTNPDLVEEIIRQAYTAGAKRVYVFDHTCDHWRSCYKNSGIRDAVRRAKGIMVPGHEKKYYKKAAVPGGKAIKTADVHELIIKSDVFINVPILKTHGSTRLTIGMKNLMGTVWSRRPWHIAGLHEKIAEFAGYRKPDLTVVDAYRVMVKNGPRGVSVNDVELMKYQVLSRDIVAADAAAAKIFGIEPGSIKYIKHAHEKGIGNMDLDTLRIKRINV
ncbi:MAG: DUF362 domain-containing protein [Candidatus Goldiibacteriota bacterium]